MVTLYVPSLSAIGLTAATDAAAAPPAGRAAADIALRAVPLPSKPEEGEGLATPTPPPRVAPPPPNAWVPGDTSALLRRPMMSALRVGACADSRQGGELPACLRQSTADGGAAGRKGRPPCLRTAPHLPPWTV